MSDYIERKAAIAAITPQYAPALNEVLADMLRRVPAADVRPVVHAAWEKIPGITPPNGRCGACKRSGLMDWKYCPNCGANMGRAEKCQ